MRSTSAITRDYLLKQTPGFMFTAEGLYRILVADNPTVTLGGVNGFASKAATEELLGAVKNGRTYTYSVIDEATTRRIRVKEGSSHGGAIGRENHHVNRLKNSSIPSIQARLLDLAAELERARTPLDTYSSEELLAELTKRQRVK